MHDCGHCGRSFKSGPALGGHQRGCKERPPPPSASLSNEQAVERQLVRLGDLGKLDDRDGLVALALTLARTLDAGAGLAVAAVSRELRAVLKELEGEKRDGAGGDFAALTRSLSLVPAPVGDTAVA